uniref:1-phosphatidylinositol-3-phosphate 5-kinase n=1 Tax=Ciona savignyi TaxID=51511 RepID=H2ZJY2_CIOSA
SMSENSSENLKQYWMPDKHCHECYECGDRFTTFRRRHHCRICGHIFCSRCCYQFIAGAVVDHAAAGMLRSCTYCYSLLMSYTKTTASTAALTSVKSSFQHLNDHDGLTEVKSMNNHILYPNCINHPSVQFDSAPSTTGSISYYKSSGLVEQSTPIKPQRRPSRPSRPSSEPSLDNEPYWVREISNEEEDNSDDGLHFWSPESTSSINSLSIESFHNFLYNNVPCVFSSMGNRLSGELSPRLEAGLQQPKFVDESVMTISAEYIRSKLKRLYFQYAMKFLRQLFTRDQLDISWADIIVPLAKEICETVTPNSDVNMEICHYVHVKKLLDNPPEDSRLFWGVVFSQNVVHNMMSSRIDNPVIMLLATPLEYQRGDYKLSSLDPIVRQESEFFKHLVSRIVSRSPDIVISQCSVSHEARRLMLDAGITLLINVKQPVMDRLSRCTGADIAGSIDQLKIARLGTCGRFRVARHYDGKRSTLIYVDGCNPSTGCSIILRDKPNYNNRHADYESRQQLARVKSALLFLVRIMYHAKLEQSYHGTDSFSIVKSVSTYLVLSDKHKLIKNRFQPNPLSLHSISPMIQPVVPFLLSESGTNSPLRSYLPDEHWPLYKVLKFVSNKRSKTHFFVGVVIIRLQVSIQQFHRHFPAPPITTANYFRSARGSNLRVERTEPTLACKDGGEKNMPEILGGDPSPLDCLEPHNHQHIYVLFSSYSLQSPNAPYPCVIPWAVDIDYYHGNDITIGGFLERYCFRPSYQCPSPTCKRPMLEHVRSFVHGNTAMNIILKELSKPVASPHILSWCWNPATKTSTDLKPLSEDGWSMSFAKYLELRLQTYPLRNICGFSPFVSFQYFIYKSSSVVESTTESEGVTRETHFDELLSLYQEERCQLRDTADDIHLILLSIRKRFVFAVSSFVASPKVVALILVVISTSVEVVNELNMQSTDGLVVNTEESSTLSSSLLELACLICKLVHTWNNRINTVLEQVRFLLKFMRSILTHLRQSANVHVASPFQADEHYLLHDTLPAGHVVRIFVRDSEPSSIIAYAMSTPAYQRFITKAAVRDDQSTTGDEMLFVENDGTSDHTSPHLELQFSDPTTKFYCKIYFAMEFKELRDQLVESEEAYMGSLARCARWAARGGKSGSAFHKTLDDRLVIKQMSRFELQSFLDVAPSYMSHITTAVNNKTPTTLSKILGVYRVSFRNNTTNRSFKQDLLIVENLFYKRNIQQVFDLKGSVRNRHSVTNQNDLVLLDENLLSIMKDHPLYVHQHSKLIIKKALHNDATFLSNHLIIDYSLLVGVDGDSKEIVIGIIDYMRTFTWDKKLEMVVKSYGMIGIQGTRSMPTVVSPQLYKTRFCEAMDRYFQAVPDRWYGLQAY